MSQLLHNRKAVEEVRRGLRKEPTRYESLLWERLRSSQLMGRKFRRQHSVGMYILDFYCPAERLAVEVDGNVHYSDEARLHDEERDATMAQLMIKTIRFTNDQVERDIEKVLAMIIDSFGWQR
ncbi:endonuclease domain-containing protein [Fibrella aquatica]|uniref:endonuclease domain-containing protein n=1 Tax=Fibrella aquatica TaxID=3242487 RepID=UPI00352251F8